MKPLSIS